MQKYEKKKAIEKTSQKLLNIQFVQISALTFFELIHSISTQQFFTTTKHQNVLSILFTIDFQHKLGTSFFLFNLKIMEKNFDFAKVIYGSSLPMALDKTEINKS